MKEELEKMIKERKDEIKSLLDSSYESPDFYKKKEEQLEFLEKLENALFDW